MKKILSIILALTLILGMAVTVSAAAEAETKAITANTGVLSNDNKTITWTGANFQFVSEQNTSNSAIRTSDTNHFRVYQDHKTTISALNGEKLAKIEITSADSSKTNNLKTSLEAVTGASVTVENEVVTATFASAVESVSFVATAQWRLNSIKITYYSGDHQHTYDNCADATCNGCGATREAGVCEYTNEYDASCNKCANGSRTVTLPEANSVITFEQADKLAKAGVTNVIYKLTGAISSIENTTYGNMYIKDTAGNEFYIYGTYSADGKDRFDAMATKPAVGDTITVSGKLSVFSNKSQMKNGWILEIKAPEKDETCAEHTYTNEYDATCDKCANGNRTVTLPEANSVITFEQADKLAKAGVTDVVYKLTGKITEIYNTEYGNMYIEDANGTKICIYGTYSADGKDRFDKMANKPAVGNTITVSGKLSVYNKAGQMKNGWILEIKTENPVTADNFQIGLLVSLMAVSCAAFVTLAAAKKRAF